MTLVPIERIESKILLIRGRKVMLDMDLAMLYGVETKVLNQAVRRNKERFPEDFMFRLTKSETKSLRSQIVTLKRVPPSSFSFPFEDSLRSAEYARAAALSRFARSLPIRRGDLKNFYFL